MERKKVGNNKSNVKAGKNQKEQKVVNNEDNSGRYHLVHPYLKNPTDHITIGLIGAGGNGSLMFSHLIKLNNCLKALGKTPIKVIVYDSDTVTEANLGRQMFYDFELGMNKAEALVKRYHRAFGDMSWEYKTYNFDVYNCAMKNILLLCVDDADIRNQMCNFKDKSYSNADGTLYYWIDLGNGFDYGQIVLSNHKTYKNKNHVEKLKNINQIFGKLVNDKTAPSCTLAEALGKQDLFCNSIISSYAANYLWKLFTVDVLYYQGINIDIKNHKVCPILV